MLLNMAENVPRLALVEGPGSVHGEYDPHLPLPVGCAAVDLGLVAGPILADVAYITEYSDPPPAQPGPRRYRSLEDTLSADALACLRAALVDLLERLLEAGESWFLFARTELAEDAMPEAFFAGQVFAGELNGRFAIFEVPAGDLVAHAALFGAFDRVVGVAAPAGSLRALLSRLSLADAFPTDRSLPHATPFCVRDTSALARVLGHGRLFFEEVDNGTRLRMIAGEPAIAGLRARVAALTGRSCP
jgi:hypothetical protein